MAIKTVKINKILVYLDTDLPRESARDLLEIEEFVKKILPYKQTRYSLPENFLLTLITLEIPVGITKNALRVVLAKNGIQAKYDMETNEAYYPLSVNVRELSTGKEYKYNGKSIDS